VKKGINEKFHINNGQLTKNKLSFISSHLKMIIPIIFSDSFISGLSLLAVSQEIDLNKFHLFIRYLLLLRIQKV